MSNRRKKSNKSYYFCSAILFFAVVVFFVLSTEVAPAGNIESFDENVEKRGEDSFCRINDSVPRDTVRLVTLSPTHGNIELPLHEPNDSLIYNHIGRYTLQYSPSNRLAMWVAYKLTASDLQGGVGRSGSFYFDAELRRRGYHVAVNEDYRGTGYDKGHLLPSADRQRSREENRATFVLSNCAPQTPALNRGLWKNLEEELRRWCERYDTLYIVTGIALDRPKGRIGKSSIAIPGYCFKAILTRRGDDFESFAYVMPNDDKLGADWRSHRVTTDSIKSLTGLDLFPHVKF